MTYKELNRNCTLRGGIARVTKPGQRPTFRVIPFRCGRSDCPICSKIKRDRLLRRIKAASWPKKVSMWTVTTDPKILTKEKAIKTISVRWHRVLRELTRAYPSLRYFRVLEFTQSGLPHLHIMFNRYVDYRFFNQVLVRHCFGKVLQFVQLPLDAGFIYMTKYITKSVSQNPAARELGLRTWSASFHFLPIVKYFEDGTEFTLIFYGHLEWDIPDMMKMLELHVSGGGSP